MKAVFLLAFMMSIPLGMCGEPRIVLVGDSTVSNYSTERPHRGWGQMLSKRAGPGVVVINKAASGTSSKSFQTAGLWEEALAMKPNYVLIQFGHNDRSKNPDKAGTKPEGEYRENLKRFVRETREIGATPIFVTPPVPRAFDAKTGVLGDGQLTPYITVMKAVGAEDNVPVLDLYARSHAWYASLGKAGATEFAPKPGDVNHYNEAGAIVLADFVQEEMKLKCPEMSPYFTSPQ